jgi:diguanylate cyclase (GGDEF)-like protein
VDAHSAPRFVRSISGRNRATFRPVPGLRVTASFGVAAAGATEPSDSIVRRADEAMYRAKAAGRNRVTIAS